MKVDIQIAQCAHGVSLVGVSLSGPHTNQYYEKTTVYLCMYLCMYVCMYVAIRRPRAH